MEILSLQAENCTSKIDSERVVSRISPLRLLDLVPCELHRLGISQNVSSDRNFLYELSCLHEKGACVALGAAANAILHNMFVADGAVWEWKEAWKVQEKRSEAFPDRRSTREGSAHCSPLLHNHFLFVFAARASHPPVS